MGKDKRNVLQAATNSVANKEAQSELASLVKLHYSFERARLSYEMAINNYREKHGYSLTSKISLVDGSEIKAGQQ